MGIKASLLNKENKVLDIKWIERYLWTIQGYYHGNLNVPDPADI